MALTFELTDIPGFLTLCFDHADSKPENDPHGDWFEDDEAPGKWLRIKPITRTLIFACSAVGQSGIYEKNLAEFIVRKRILDGFALSPDLMWTDTQEVSLYQYTGSGNSIEAMTFALKQGWAVEAGGRVLAVTADDSGQDGLSGNDADEAVRLAVEDPKAVLLVQHTPRGRNVSPLEIRAHLGLRTNVANEKRPRWLKSVTDSAVEEFTRQLATEAAKAAKANTTEQGA